MALAVATRATVARAKTLDMIIDYDGSQKST